MAASLTSWINVWALLSLFVVLLGVGVLMVTATVSLMALSILRPPRMSDGKALYLLRRLAPDDLGLPYESIDFTVRDPRTGRPLRICGWWIPAEPVTGEPGEAQGQASPGGGPYRCAVLIHGYADAKVGAIAWAPLWHALGYHLLVPDLRGHGESGGRVTTAGFFEREDLVQVINQIRAQRPHLTRRLVLFGASLGASVAAATAAALEPGDLSAVVLESPFADFRHAAAAHMERLGLPGGLIRSTALWLAQKLSGADYAGVRVPELIPKVAAPVMVITPPRDVFLLPGDAEAIRAALAARAGSPFAAGDVYWETDECEHLMAIVRNPGEYRRRIESFLVGAGLALHVENPSPKDSA